MLLAQWHFELLGFLQVFAFLMTMWGLVNLVRLTWRERKYLTASHFAYTAFAVVVCLSIWIIIATDEKIIKIP